MSTDSSPIRILVVDDHQLIRVGIATLLLPESDMKVVGEASNGREAIAKFRECDPDVTLMDLQMPEMSGFDAILAIRDEFPGARIIVLTTYDGDVQAQRAIQRAGGHVCDVIDSINCGNSFSSSRAGVIAIYRVMRGTCRSRC